MRRAHPKLQRAVSNHDSLHNDAGLGSRRHPGTALLTPVDHPHVEVRYGETRREQVKAEREESRVVSREAEPGCEGGDRGERRLRRRRASLAHTSRAGFSCPRDRPALDTSALLAAGREFTACYQPASLTAVCLDCCPPSSHVDKGVYHVPQKYVIATSMARSADHILLSPPCTERETLSLSPSHSLELFL